MTEEKLKELVKENNFIMEYNEEQKRYSIKKEENSNIGVSFEEEQLVDMNPGRLIFEVNRVSDIDISEEFTRENVLNKVIPVIVKENQKDSHFRVEKPILKQFGEWIQGYKYILDNDVLYESEGIGAITMTEKILKSLDITEKELEEAALRNIEKELEVKTMIETLKGTLGEEFPEELIEDDARMWVISTKNKLYGASVVYSQKNILTIKRTIKERLWKKGEIQEKGLDELELIYIPSSIHEMIVLAVTETPNYNELRGMVRAVNEKQVDEKDQLSDNIFEFRVTKGEGKTEFYWTYNSETDPWEITLA